MEESFQNLKSDVEIDANERGAQEEIHGGRGGEERAYQKQIHREIHLSSDHDGREEGVGAAEAGGRGGPGMAQSAPRKARRGLYFMADPTT